MTPQERIEKYRNRFLDERAKEFSIMFSDNLVFQKQLEVGYLNGATEQRMLDIKKAYDFIKRNTTLDRWVNVDAIAEQLRKAMEEE